jgi:hypothetical protein
MATINLKVSGNDASVDFPWFNENMDNLLGNPRPSTLQDIQKDQYWANLLAAYCHANGAGAEYDAWSSAGFGNGAERDALKNVQVVTETKGTKDIREAFRADVGWMKALLKEKQKQDEGLGSELNDTFNLDWPN